MPENLLIFPFGGSAREALMSVFAINVITEKWDVIGFIDDNPSVAGRVCCGIKVLGDREFLKRYPEAKILAVPCEPSNYLMRKKIIEGLSIADSRFATVIHPSVSISPDSSIGFNTVLMPNVVISCGVKVGNHCVILPNSVVSHDSVIGDYCCIGSNVSISGKVVIGSNCFIGTGTMIKESITIGDISMTGLGSNVIRDVGKGVVVVGNPARNLRKIVL